MRIVVSSSRVSITTKSARNVKGPHRVTTSLISPLGVFNDLSAKTSCMLVGLSSPIFNFSNKIIGMTF
ncbi:hypothetical protein LINPERHAP1_LOCUS21922, partial [Linum perenne]